MSDKKDKQATENEGKAPKEHVKRTVSKSRWTLEVCSKAASRFESEEAWAQGFPSSYKAAVAHGFVAECMRHMKTRDISSAKAKVKAKETKSKTSARKLPKSA